MTTETPPEGTPAPKPVSVSEPDSIPKTPSHGEAPAEEVEEREDRADTAEPRTPSHGEAPPENGEPLQPGEAKREPEE